MRRGALCKEQATLKGSLRSPPCDGESAATLAESTANPAPAAEQDLACDTRPAPRHSCPARNVASLSLEGGLHLFPCTDDSLYWDQN